jgi:ABC-type transport system substrate-binding protein
MKTAISKADDVVWNLSRSTNDKAASSTRRNSLRRSYLGNFVCVEKIDDYTVVFETKGPDSLFPYEISGADQPLPRQACPAR